MRLTVLGCSGSVPEPDSPASGYLVQHAGFSLVLDLGNGAFGALQRHIAPQDVDAVVLSHLHPDHCIDMAAYEVALTHGPPRRGHSRLPVLTPAGAGARLAAGARADPLAAPNSREMSAFAFDDPGSGSTGGDPPMERRLGPFRLAFARMAHSVPTYAVRVSIPGGPSLVYSGDTGETDELVALAAGAELLVCEAAFVTGPANAPGLHLTGRQAGEHAERAGVARLMITHVPPWYSVTAAVGEASETFHGAVMAAESDAAVDI